MNFLSNASPAGSVPGVSDHPLIWKIGAAGAAGSWTLFGMSLQDATHLFQFLSAFLAFLVSLITLVTIAIRWCKARRKCK